MTEVAAAPQARRQVFISLRFKLIIAFTVLFSVVFAASYYWFYSSSVERALARVTEDLNVVLTGAAAKINGDDVQQLAATGKANADGYTDDPRYKAHVQWLYAVHQLDPRASLYTFVAGPKDREITFVGSSGALDNPPTGAAFLQVCTEAPDDCGDLTQNLQAISTGQVVDQTDIYSDGFGNWISGYIPLKNSSGKIIGALGVDFQADYVAQVRQSILNSVVVAFVLAYSILFVTVWLISRTLSKPIINLTRVAQHIGEGNYDQDLSLVKPPGFTQDEIDTLTGVFKIMVAKVAKREEVLKQQVADLQIILDHSKRDEQVKEIVENDFFQSLQSKAYEMRSRRQTQETETESE
jgi:HAMP domain-containing protein